MSFQVSDVAGLQARTLERRGNNPLLGNPVRHRQAARCAVLVDRAAADHRPNPVTVANRVLETFDDDDAATLAAHVAVRGRIECLAPAVGRQHVRAGENHHGRRGEQRVRTAGQREVAFPQAQRLACLMDSHQRRAARRVDGDRGTVQPQPMADPARCRSIRRPDAQIGLDLGGGQLAECHSQKVMGSQTDENTGVGISQRRRRSARMLHRPPRRLQQEPMLRVHHADLARRHTEERRVEPRHVIDETGTTGHDLPRNTWFRIEELVGIPPVPGHLRYRIPAFPQHLPKFVRVRGTRKTRRVADDRETRRRLHQTRDGRPSALVVGFGTVTFRDLLSHIVGDHAGGSVVEDQRGWQRQPGSGIEAVAQFDASQRVEAEGLEFGLGVDVLGGRPAQHLSGLHTHHPYQQVVLFTGSEPIKSLCQCRLRLGGTTGVLDLASSRAACEPAEQHRQPTALGQRVQRGPVQAGGHHHGVINHQRGVK